jgi:hypothetical protein
MTSFHPGTHPQLLSQAKFKPLGKLHVTSASSGGSVSYHIPAASSIEIQLSTVAAVSSLLKVSLPLLDLKQQTRAPCPLNLTHHSRNVYYCITPAPGF